MINKQQITREKFENILQKIKECLFLYDNKYYSDKTFNLFLANGNKINYTIPESSIAHLLGVDTNYLKSTSVLSFESNKSIDILRTLCDENNWYSLYSKVSSGIININQLFSEHINVKLDIFENNIKPIIYNMEFICKIDRNKLHNDGIDYMNIDYLICTKDSNDNYLVLGIVKNDRNYVARTSQMYQSEEDLYNDLGKIIKNQELTFACRLIINNNFDTDYIYKPIVLTPDNKREKIYNLKKYKKMFDAYVDTLEDYNFVLGQDNQQYSILKEISERMHNGEIIDIETIASSCKYLPDIIRNIIEQYNNAFVGKLGSDSKKYSDVINENIELKGNCDKLNVENRKLKEVNLSMTEQIDELTKENVRLNNIFDETELILSKRRK